MSDKKNIVIERIATPDGDVPKVEGVIEAFNIIISKISELNKKINDNLKLMGGDFTGFSADLSVAKDDIIELKQKIEDNMTELNEIQNKLQETSIITEKIESIIPKLADGSEAVMTSSGPEIARVIDEIKVFTQNFQDFIENINISREKSPKTSLEDIYKIVSHEEINIKLDMLGDYQVNKEIILSRGRFIKLPKQIIDYDSKILLYGPSGNGKTSTVYAIAKDLEFNIIELNIPLLLVSNIGLQIELINEIFKLIKTDEFLKPCILLIENIQLLNELENNSIFILNFVNLLDQINLSKDKILVICTAFDKELIDYSLLSRFDQICEFNYPNEIARSEIFYKLLSNHKIDDNLDLDLVISNLASDEKTLGFSCRNIVKIVENAYFKVLTEEKEVLTEEDLNFAYNQIMVQRLEKQVRKQKSLKYQDSRKMDINTISYSNDIEARLDLLKSQLLINQKIIKNALRLALSENYNLVSRLVKLFETGQGALDIEEIRKISGMEIKTCKKILNKEPFSIIFPRIGTKYAIAFNYDLYTEIITEFELNK
ncbi:MAG: ATP-binding protein [Candidatus Helarchaeota archaeon]